MIRPWTGATKLEWIQRRDAYRKSKSLPALASIRNSSDGDDQVAYKSALDAERGCLLDRMDASTTKNECWPVSWSAKTYIFIYFTHHHQLDKHPLREYRAPFAGELFLPLSYRQKHGVSQVFTKSYTQFEHIEFIIDHLRLGSTKGMILTGQCMCFTIKKLHQTTLG